MAAQAVLDDAVGHALVAAHAWRRHFLYTLVLAASLSGAVPIASAAALDGYTPFPDTLRVRSDGWERDMLFSVDQQELPERVEMRFAVTGCDLKHGLIAIVEVNGQTVDAPDAFNWSVGEPDPLIGAGIAEIVCRGALGGPSQANTFTPQSNSRRTLPKFSDYGTDMQSLGEYLAALQSVSLEACKIAYRTNADAAYCLASRGDTSETMKMLTLAANLGQPLAMNDLAECLMALERPEDVPEIRRLIILAAEAGIPNAQVTLGWWSMRGEFGIAVNYADAMTWNMKGYQQGHSEGANNIGEIYERGLGVPANRERRESGTVGRARTGT